LKLFQAAFRDRLFPVTRAGRLLNAALGARRPRVWVHGRMEKTVVFWCWCGRVAHQQTGIQTVKNPEELTVRACGRAWRLSSEAMCAR